MKHGGEAQSLVAELLTPLMSLLFKGATRKVILQDPNDIKAGVERENTDQTA